VELLATVATTAAALAALSTITTTAIAAGSATTTTTTTAVPATAAASSSTSTTTTTAAVATAAAAFTFGAGGALFAGTRDVHRQGAAFDFMAMEFLHAFLGFVACAHRDEGETAGTTGEFVEDDFDDVDGANLAEQGFEILRRAGEGKIPDVEL